MILRYLLMPMAAHLLFLIPAHNQVAAMADIFPRLFLDPLVDVALGMQVDLLLAFIVLEAELVVIVCAAMLRTARFECADGLMVGQLVGWHLVGVVDAAGDDRPVGVAFKELDDNFLSHARSPDGPPILPGPRVGDADPTGALVVLFAYAVPEELYLHPAVLIGVDLLAAGSHDHGHLGSLHKRPRREPGRTKGHGGRDADKGVRVTLARATRAGAVGLAHRGGMMDFGEHVALVQVLAAMFVELEFVAGYKGHAIAPALRDEMRSFLLFHARLDQRIPVVSFQIIPWKVINLQGLAGIQLHDGIYIHFQIGGRSFEVVIGERVLAGTHLLGHMKLRDDIVTRVLDIAKVVVKFILVVRVVVNAGRIGQNQPMSFNVVLKVIKDPEVLQKAGDKVEVRFAVLHAVLELRVGLVQWLPVVFYPTSCKDVLKDFHHVFLLENTAIGVAAEKPQPRDHFRLIVGNTLFGFTLDEAADVPVDVTMTLSVAGANVDGHPLAEDLLVVDGVLRGKHLQLEAKELRDAFGPVETFQEQDVRSQRGFQL